VPLVSVIMAAYNTERFIAQAIRSVQAQTVEDWELLVADDASTDGTAPVVEAIAAADPRVRLLTADKQGGPGPARNRALWAARGTYVAILDSDDLAYPHRFATCLDRMRQEPGVRFVHGNVDFIAENGVATGRRWPPVGRPRDVDTILLSGLDLPWHSTWFAERQLLAEAGGYDPAFAMAQDADLWLRIRHAAQARYVPCAVGAWRYRAGSCTADSLKHGQTQWVCGLAAYARGFAADRDVPAPTVDALVDAARTELQRWGSKPRLWEGNLPKLAAVAGCHRLATAAALTEAFSAEAPLPARLRQLVLALVPFLVGPVARHARAKDLRGIIRRASRAL